MPPLEGGDIFMEERMFGRTKHYNWRCRLCGQRGMALSSKRWDLLEWALENHKCRPTALSQATDKLTA